LRKETSPTAVDSGFSVEAVEKEDGEGGGWFPPVVPHALKPKRGEV
jgi:hypothetical protein